ncbi:hypothetical protein C8T65DRAFT_699622 [Cerioporus squamosus]|nr:hypothetical protein C8T65DRAFT_699622 [Cerioporus squamosus]
MPATAMDHFCTICNAPFLSEDNDVETETVATSCECAEREGATCYLCNASIREDNKFTKIYLTYDNDEYDMVLTTCAKNAAAEEAAAQDSGLVDLEQELEALQGKHTYNLDHIEQLDRWWTTVKALCELYQERLKWLERREGREVEDSK